MKVEISTSKDFNKDVKRLYKRYKSLLDDLKEFRKGLENGDIQGDEMMKGVYKYRMAITSKNKGKSGGARIISSEILVSIEEKSITLLTIYDKSDMSSIPDSEVRALMKRAGLI